ncbi:hypothetical protein EKO04_004049 [Ascochyta lentis]|uniref:Uncharacterized protein n=1 Tax=Ascochyta lentis TaxID=205686 RepID=A0A8H7J6C6_9PLEO|nr:hypothetical protein EKO04_004049 [Ascochyta lentis]
MADGPSTLPAESANSPQHHILLSIPRTASNLLTHLLALHSQPSIAPHPRDGYFFLPALSFRFTHDTLMQPYETRNDLEKKNMQSSIDNGIKGWKSRINETEEKRKGTYIKEHVTRPIRPSPERAFLHDEKSDSNSSGTANETAQRYTNPQSSLTRSGLASEPLSSPRPSALVPECAAPASITRGSTPGAARARCCRGGSPRPRQQTEGPVLASNNVGIVDAATLVSPAFVQHYAGLVGLDPKRVRMGWEATSQGEQEEMHTVERRMKDTLVSSASVLVQKLDSTAIEIAAEKKKWGEEFGSVLAERFDRLVREAMADYEWLRERRLRL